MKVNFLNFLTITTTYALVLFVYVANVSNAFPTNNTHSKRANGRHRHVSSLITPGNKVLESRATFMAKPSSPDKDINKTHSNLEGDVIASTSKHTENQEDSNKKDPRDSTTAHLPRIIKKYFAGLVHIDPQDRYHISTIEKQIKYDKDCEKLRCEKEKLKSWIATREKEIQAYNRIQQEFQQFCQENPKDPTLPRREKNIKALEQRFAISQKGIENKERQVIDLEKQLKQQKAESDQNLNCASKDKQD